MNSEYANMQGIFNEGKPSDNKVKKKKKPFGLIKLTIVALLFGIVAGAAFQGYVLMKNPVELTQETGEDDTGELKADTTSDSELSYQNASIDGIVTDVSQVVDEVMPAIVSINTTTSRTSYDFFGREYRQEGEARGSGIIIAHNNNELLVVTNSHVVEEARNIEVTFADDSKSKAKIKGSDTNSDLAILSVNLNDLSQDTVDSIKVATLGDSDNVKPGDIAIAIGNALGYGQSVTVGYISALDREIPGDSKGKLIQTDAAINPGNSGGALLNSAGQVIGINSVKYASTEVEGVGYAIPITKAIPMINELMNREVVSSREQGFLGIDISKAQNVTEIHSQRFNMPVGVYVYSVVEDSPAEKAGLKQGNIITGLDNIQIRTIDDLINALSYKKAGQTIKLRIQEMENGKYVEKVLEITLAKKK